MPKKQPIYSCNKELWEKSHQPATTISMGMKNSLASSLCWSQYINHEQKIADLWMSKYDPERSMEQVKLDALHKTVERDAKRRADYHNPALNPELHAILKGHGGGAKKKQPVPIDADPHPSTDAMDREARLAAVRLMDSRNRMKDSASDVAAPRKEEDWSTTMAASYVRYELPLLGQPVGNRNHPALRDMRPTKLYLQARCDKYAPPERFPEGPITSTQVLGWNVAELEAKTRTSALYKPVRAKGSSVGPYRRPEDAEHAALFGYDLNPK